MQSEQINELAAALAAAQGEFPAIPKSQVVDAGTYTYRYADLADVLAAVRPALTKHGLAVSQPLQAGATLMLETMLLHKSGQWLSGSYEIQRHPKPQEQGSAITYARRYAIAAILGIAAEEDDDGKAAQQAKPAKASMASPFPAPSAQSHKLPPCEPGDDEEPERSPKGAMMPQCPHCKSSKAVIASKYAPGEFCCWEKSMRDKGCGLKFSPTAATDQKPAALPACPACGSAKAVVTDAPNEFACAKKAGGCGQEWRGRS